VVKKFILQAVNHPKAVVIISIIFVLLSVIQYPKIKVDTDPENMLPSDAPVRVFHHEMKKEFSLYDFIVLGVINEKDPEGAFNVATLNTIYQLTEEIKHIDGVIAREIVAPSTKDNIEEGELGSVRFNWLMSEPVQTQPEALKIRAEAMDHPIFKGSIVSEDGRAISIMIPIEKKDISYEVAQEIRGLLKKYSGDEEYHITGLPIAEDQFGVEMFKQMAISAPLAGLIIFLLMWFFFKSVQLVIAPMLVALGTVFMTMGLLIGIGFPVHIMSSMIPIFLMPISVLDSVHILSEFFDKYHKFNDRKATILHVMDELFTPMLFTSLTSIAGFFSLSFSPIPPVQVFGVFVALGIAVAWVLTILFIPAFVMLLPQKIFNDFGHHKEEGKKHLIDTFLASIKNLCLKNAKAIIGISALLFLLSIYGISHIRVNDNPVRWFEPKHPIRVADRILNKHFSGTYEAYLVMEAQDKAGEIFINPAMLSYIEKLQDTLMESPLVGKTTALTDIVKKVYYELLGGDKANEVIPQTKEAVAQCLISFENSHKPDDLWHVTTPDYSKANIWLQLKSGDNRDMSSVAKMVKAYIEKNPAPYKIHYDWAGLTHINVVWQDEMVGGMIINFIGSFIIVLFMMVFLFRSPVKALLSMIPLTITILFIYSLLGFFGKDYDMPVAVLSALTLGLSVDFAIHFIQRALEVYKEKGSWPQTADVMFAGPGRAIVRNALVVAIGFLPLLAAPLVPYKTVGFFMFMIMAVSSVATLVILPAIISFKPQWIFSESPKGMGCRCSHCVLMATFVSATVAYLLTGYSPLKWHYTVFISIGVIVGLSALCHFVSRSKLCLTEKGENK